MKAKVKKTCTLVCGEGSVVELSPKQFELAKKYLEALDSDNEGNKKRKKQLSKESDESKNKQGVAKKDQHKSEAKSKKDDTLDNLSDNGTSLDDALAEKE